MNLREFFAARRSRYIGRASALAMVMASQHAFGQLDEPVSIELPKQSLSRALSTIGKTYGVTIVAPGEFTAGKEAPAVTGDLTALQAVARVLAQSNLSAQETEGGAILIANPAGSGQGQSARPVAESGGTGSADQIVEEIVVQGKVFTQSLTDRLNITEADLPFSFDVIDRQTIDLRSFDRFSDVLRTLPNVVSTNRSPTANFQDFSVRGLESTFLTNNRPDNYAGNPVDNSAIASMELLRGPASIVAGPVRPGAVVNVVLKTPAPDDFLHTEFTAGNRDFYRVEADANRSTLFNRDSISARVNVAYETSGFPQDGADADRISIRPIIELRPGERTTVQLSASYYEHNEDHVSRFPLLATGSTPPNLDAGTQVGPLGRFESEDKGVELVVEHELLDNLRLTARGQRYSFDNESGGTSYVYNYNNDGLDPANPYAYSYYAYFGTLDRDLVFADVQADGEFEFGGRAHSFAFGTSYVKFDEGGSFGGLGGFRVVSYNDPASFDFSGPSLDGLPATPEPEAEYELLSYYGEIALRPTDWLTLPVGIRYDGVEETFAGETVGDSSDISVRAGVSARVAPHLNVYASYAESLVPQTGRTLSNDFIDPENGVAIELGLKYRSADGKVDVDAAIFEITRDNVSERDPASPPGQEFVRNAGEQTSRGFELSAAVRDIAGFSFSAGVGYVDAETSNASELGFSGLPVRGVPERTFTFSGSYRFSSGPLNALEVGFAGQYQDERPASVQPGRIIEVPDVFLADFFAVYPISERYELQINVINAFDREYIQNPGFSSLSGGYTFGDPRTLRLSVKGRF
ncbi:MAG: TonB-dependent receptor [Pseudomonadota bacterium]